METCKIPKFLTNKPFFSESEFFDLTIHAPVISIKLASANNCFLFSGPTNPKNLQYLVSFKFNILGLESFKYNYYTKDLQGAVDSGIITFLIEFGLIISIVIIYFLINTLMRLIRNSQNINILLVQIILLLIISGTTQVIGLSKISWFFVIIFAISRNLNNVLSIKYIKKNVNIL